MSRVTDGYAKEIAEKAEEELIERISGLLHGYSFEDLVERIWNDAYDEGYDKGYDEGHEEGYDHGCAEDCN